MRKILEWPHKFSNINFNIKKDHTVYELLVNSICSTAIKCSLASQENTRAVH